MEFQIKEKIKVIIPKTGKELTSLKKEDLLNILAKEGVVLLRGFNTDLKKYSDFVAKMSSKVTLDPARKFHEKNAQKVDAGTDAVGLHIENGNGPIVPDLCWFFCKEAPNVGSQTTVCDGLEVYQQMDENLKKIFSDNKIIYSRSVPEEIWRKYISHELHGAVKPEDVDDNHLKLVQENLPDLKIKIQEDGRLKYSFTVNPVFKKNGDRYFANSILGPSYNYEKPKITFEDGKELDEELIHSISALTDQCTVNIEWQDGDIALIDNKRVMHGRREIIDERREIFNALSFV